jgi:hypothetical protein
MQISSCGVIRGVDRESWFWEWLILQGIPGAAEIQWKAGRHALKERSGRAAWCHRPKWTVPKIGTRAGTGENRPQRCAYCLSKTLTSS